MNKIRNVNWELIWDKVGTVLVDRRFWPSIITLALLVFGTPEAMDHVDGLSEQAEAYTQIILQFLGIIIPYLKLMDSWTERKPSGLDFKQPRSESDEIAEAIVEAIKNQ